MNYQKHYNLLIKKALNRNIGCYLEEHHILPRCLGGSNDRSNLIKLTPEEHFLAHKLLTKMYPDNLKVLYAFNFMSAPISGRKIDNKKFGFVRRQISELMKTDLNPIKRFPEKNYMKNRSGPNHPCYGRILSENEKINLSNRMKVDNPCKGINPWNHPRCDTINKKIWIDADKYYENWVKTKDSYYRLSKKFGYKFYTSSHINMIKKFKSGWNPNSDLEWIDFKNKYKE